MADNKSVNSGVGINVATDEIAGVDYQRMKLADGTADSTTMINAGNGVAANALRVTLASDGTGVVSISGTVTVASHAVTNAGTFATQASQAGTWNITNISGTITLPTGASTAANQSTMITALQLIDDTVFTDDAAFTAGTNKLLAVGGIVTADSVDSGDAGAFAMLANRQQKITIYNSAGAEVTSFGGGTEYTEDAAAAANPVGPAMIVVREDARAGSLTTTDGDNVALRGNNLGELYVKHTDTIPVTGTGTFAVQVSSMPALVASSANIGDVDVLTLGGQTPAYGSGVNGSTVLRVALATDSPGITATVAHDVADTGDPIKFGAKAAAGLSGATMVAAADRTNAVSSLDGALAVRTVHLEDIISGNASNTDGTSTQVIAAAGSGIKNYLSRVTLTNMHATTMVYVELKSGTTVMHTIPAPPGGSTIGFDPPLPPNAANEAWNFDASAAVTTLYCSMVGFKSKI